MALDPQERSALALALLDSLDGANEAAVADAWTKEVRVRLQRLRDGTDKAIPWSQVRDEIDAL